MDIMDVDRTGLGVLVGVDGSESAAEALEFAAEEARLRERPLTVAHVRPERAGGARGDDDPVLDDAAARLGRSGARGVSARFLPEQGRPERVLDTLAAGAELTVVGSRGRGGVSGMLLGSVSTHLAANAPGPVVVVRPHSTSRRHRPFARHVVVGVDGSAASEAALGFGFAEAEWRRVPLAAVHAHYLPPVDTYVDDTTLELHAERRPPGRDLLDAAVDPWAARHPGVDVKRALYEAPEAAGLLRAAAGCTLLVVGRTHRSVPAGLVFGSVGQAALHHACCPVAVVPSAGPTP